MNKPYNSDIQIWAMKQRFPQFKAIKRSMFDIEFIGDLQVKPTFPVYTISISYRGSLTPLVRVIKPELVEKPPHFYKEQNALCLYHADDFKWNKAKLIAREIVAWSAAWIYFYELWLRDGKWYGPEASHSTTPNIEIMQHEK